MKLKLEENNNKSVNVRIAYQFWCIRQDFTFVIGRGISQAGIFRVRIPHARKDACTSSCKVLVTVVWT
jgi:hypothetical protein